MRRFLVLAMVILGLSATSAAVLPIVRAGDVTVTASYTGKGVVDSSHEILVFLFDHPMPTESSEPLRTDVITKNGGSVAFKNVTTEPVYVILVYDEASNYDGQSGPPPVGTPIAVYSKDGKAAAVKPGPDAKVSVTFDGSRRWGK
jgi:hypothetical protein